MLPGQVLPGPVFTSSIHESSSSNAQMQRWLPEPVSGWTRDPQVTCGLLIEWSNDAHLLIPYPHSIAFLLPTNRRK